MDDGARRRDAHLAGVGNVTSYSLPNVIFDNYFFGIAAVGRNGQESLVAFPR